MKVKSVLGTVGLVLGATLSVQACSLPQCNYTWKIIGSGEVITDQMINVTAWAASANGSSPIADVLESTTFTSGNVVGALITKDQGDECTGMWSDVPVNLNQCWSMRFGLYVGNADFGSTADGLAFVLQNDPRTVSAIGYAGAAIGYGSTGPAPVVTPALTPIAISPSVEVEFDTYQNGGAPICDPPYQHISIHANGDSSENVNTTCQPTPDPNNLTNAVYFPTAAPWNFVECGTCTSNLFDTNGIWGIITDGKVHILEIDWTPQVGSQEIQISVDGNVMTSYTKDMITNIFGGATSVYWGFTGSTGGTKEEQYVLDVACQPTPTVTSTETRTFTLTATPTASPTSTATGTPTGTPTVTSTETSTVTPTPSATLTATGTQTDSPTTTATGSDTQTDTQTATATPTTTDSPQDTETVSTTATSTSTVTPTLTETPSVTPTDTPTPSSTSTPTNTPSLTDTPSSTSTPSGTPTAEPTLTATPTVTTTPLSSATQTQALGPGGPFTILAVYPHPIPSSGTVFAVRVPDAGLVELDIYTLKGEKVVSLSQSYAQGGSFELPWDTNNSDGNPVAFGSYYVMGHYTGSGSHAKAGRWISVVR